MVRTRRPGPLTLAGSQGFGENGVAGTAVAIAKACRRQRERACD